MTDLLKLAGRVEMATGPDRELNAEVLKAFGWREENGDVIRPDGGLAFDVPFVLASLDAASGLFPPNTMYRSGHSALAPDPSMFFCDAVTEDGRDFHALAMTEAGARVAASLRARARSTG